MNNDNNDRDNVNGYLNENGKFAPGNPGKPKGSSKNRLRDEIKKFIEANLVNMPIWFKALKPKEKLDVIRDFMPYVCPRLQAVSMVDSEGNDLPIQPITGFVIEIMKDDPIPECDR